MDARSESPYRVALLYPGDSEARRRSAPEESRFVALFRALADLGVRAEPAVYHDDFRDEVREQLARVDAVLVWVNPLHDGHDRAALDAMLREVAAAGVYVSAHPDVIAKLGTKEVLYRTRELDWGCDTHLYRSIDELRGELPRRLARGARVLKRTRGNGGNGVWKVEADSRGLRGRHARRGSVEERLTLEEFCRRLEPYFAGGESVIDQEYQPRLPEGMVRCYLVHGDVAGLGLQAINALCPAPPGPRLYHPPTLPAYRSLRERLEQQWVPALQRVLEIDAGSLPVLWDCDFLLGPKRASGEDTYVLCEINASSVAPFPDSAVQPVARAALERARAARRRRRPTP